MLIEADAFTPVDAPASAPAAAARGAEAGAAAPAPVAPAVSPATVNLHQNITRLKLNVAQIVPLHGPRVATLEELAKTVNQAGTR